MSKTYCRFCNTTHEGLYVYCPACGKYLVPDLNRLEHSDEPASANAKLGLPRDKMKKLKSAYDVDGTLRCNCTPECQEPNQRIVDMFNIEASFKNTDMYVWSGGGAAYALRFARLYGLNVKDSHCISKIGAPQMDRAVDDIQDTAIAHQNYIVDEKRTGHGPGPLCYGCGNPLDRDVRHYDYCSKCRPDESPFNFEPKP